MDRLRAAAVAVTLLAAGCAGASSADTTTVVATVYPLAWIAQQVAPDVDVVSLAGAGQDPHDQELTPRQRGALEHADLVVHIGDVGFQPQVESAVAGREAVVSVTDVVGRDALRSPDEHGEEDSDHGVVDPHVWFDPTLLGEVAVAVGAALAEADPAGADGYRSRAADTQATLERTAGEMAQLLRSCRHDTVVVGHEAFAYLVEPHDIAQHGISGAGGHSEASPADVAALVREIRDRGLPAVLTEPVEGRRDAEVVAREAGVDLVEIYSLDIVDGAQSERGLPALLVEQAEAVATAAACT